MKIATAKQIRELERRAIQELGIPSILLMEQAAMQVLKHVDLSMSYFVVVAGRGNNGGDGLALARKLRVLGKDVDIYYLCADASGSAEAVMNLNICKNMGINTYFLHEEADLWDLREAINDADVVIDAIFGIGLSRPVKGIHADVIEIINEMSRCTISIDVPSGIHADSGEILGTAIRATKTVTFFCYKKGFLNYCSVEYCGDIAVENAGIHQELINQVGSAEYLIRHETVTGLIPRRSRTGYKGDYGKVLIVAGSPGYTGANKIASEACIASGAGLVTVSSDPRVMELISDHVREAMTVHPDCIEEAVAGSNVIAFGPGMGNNEDTMLLLIRIIKKLRAEGKSDTVLILDADGLNVLEGQTDLLENIGVRIILTPHFGEMARLTGLSIEEIKKNRMDICKKFARRHHVTVVLKGHNTIISDGVTCFVNPTGSSAIASGGMGDCLTGLMAGLAGQRLAPIEAAIAAAYIHGRIGDELAKSRYAVTASEIIAKIPFELKRMVQEEGASEDR
ncbi:NAD(P)HX epimerase / NAD(P)HX dehydratase [Clostridiaceae bacterium JG1575]|nr:NAD(P)HX epimerase / NAD(P)HX dehydratase [Clostridiaceae bacterium JG1575]